MKKLVPGLFALLLILARCESDNPVSPASTIPEITLITAPDTLYTISTIPHYIFAHVTDAQGLSDIASVECDIVPANQSSTVMTLNLVNDGTNGDAIPSDNIFTSPINTSFANGNAGTYWLKIIATDDAGHESVVSQHSVVVLDGEENNPPVASQLSTPQTISIEKELDYLFTAHVSDPQGASDIELVLLNFYSATSPIPAATDTLHDDGQNGDNVANDGVFTAAVPHSKFSAFVPGQYTVKIQAQDKANARSNALLIFIKFIREGNDPPVIFDVVAPDTMLIPLRGDISTVLAVTATDPQGPSDIKSVNFYTIKPDGTYGNNGNPLNMADDGQTANNGDATANDGIYSLRIYLISTNATGDYTFRFQAVDKSDSTSNEINHIITVVK
ncbi:hypothetical protein JW960_01230 [candidate division KSB1 bacterium]|nr:hypothetical protein [candidate division KSB1 bacterium]